MSEDLEFSANIIREILEFMQKDIAEITEDTKKDKLRRVKEIISELSKLPRNDGGIIWPGRLERFEKLDSAQKAFVILAAADKQLDFSIIIQQGKKIEPIIKLSYLREVRWFSQVAKKVEEITEGKENIKKYLEKNPTLKRIGCGNFAKNFPDHVLRLLGHLLFPKII
ncbi:MAG: hypothetical protein ACFFD2_25355 [Promethearchaeota archaeon]